MWWPKRFLEVMIVCNGECFPRKSWQPFGPLLKVKLSVGYRESQSAVVALQLQGNMKCPWSAKDRNYGTMRWVKENQGMHPIRINKFTPPTSTTHEAPFVVGCRCKRDSREQRTCKANQGIRASNAFLFVRPGVGRARDLNPAALKPL